MKSKWKRQTKTLSRNGVCTPSQAKHSKFLSALIRTSSRHTSHPIIRALHSFSSVRYLPFPHPTSATKQCSPSFFKNDSGPGQAYNT